MAGYDIYEKDGAVFRGMAGSFLVSEIQKGDEWIPYTGDRVASALFGDHIGVLMIAEAPANHIKTRYLVGPLGT